ncbi:MAG: response regulator, partial [Spirochaetota bacterium]
PELPSKGGYMPSILIVDDDEMIAKVMSHYFEDVGYNTHIVESGEAALDSIRNELPDYLITDLRLPGMTGFDLLSAALSLSPSLKCILMSGAIDYDLPENLVKLGISRKNLIQKPERLSRIEEVLKEL